MKSKWRYAALTAMLVACLGCGTLVTLSDNKQWPNQIYAGTRASALGHSTQIDVPFSLVADTIVLPYTIPRTIYNYTNVDTLFYDHSIARIHTEIHGASVLVIYSATDNNSSSLWPQLLKLANQKRKYYVGFYIYSIDKNKTDAARLASRHGLPPFLLYWVKSWNEDQLKAELESVGVQVQKPITLPIVAVFDSKGSALKQWQGIRDIAEVEGTVNSIYAH